MHLARDPEFAGKAKYGNKYELALRQQGGAGGSRKITARVASFDWDAATVDLAEMAPVSEDDDLPKYITHVFNGAVRTLGFREFAAAAKRWQAKPVRKKDSRSS